MKYINHLCTINTCYCTYCISVFVMKYSNPIYLCKYRNCYVRKVITHMDYTHIIKPAWVTIAISKHNYFPIIK